MRTIHFLNALFVHFHRIYGTNDLDALLLFYLSIHPNAKCEYIRGT